jgi:hypothetical protein
MTAPAVLKARTVERRWGRLLWVAVTNFPVIGFSIYVLNDVYRDDMHNSLGSSPYSAFWNAVRDNPSFAVALFLAGIGLLLETIRRRAAAFVNCGFWLMVSIYYAIAVGPIPSAVVIGILIVSVVLYFVPAKARLFDERR